MPGLKKPTNTLLKNNNNSQTGVATGAPSSGSTSSVHTNVATTTGTLAPRMTTNVPSSGTTILINSVPQNNNTHENNNAPKRTVQMLSAPPQPQSTSPSTTQPKRGRKKKSDTTVKKELFINTETKPEVPSTSEPVTSSIIHNNSSTPTKLVCPSTPTRKKKNRPTFAVAKIKRIIQSDEEIGKISAVVPILISRALELFIQDLVVTSSKITKKKNAGTVSTAHLKETIEAEERFDFLRNKVKNVQLLSTTTNDAVMSDDEESTGKKGKKKKSKKSKEDIESDEDDESLDSDPSESNSLPISFGQSQMTNSELPVAASSSGSVTGRSQLEQQVKQEPSQSYYNNPYQTPQFPTLSPQSQQMRIESYPPAFPTNTLQGYPPQQYQHYPPQQYSPYPQASHGYPPQHQNYPPQYQQPNPPSQSPQSSQPYPHYQQ